MLPMKVFSVFCSEIMAAAVNGARVMPPLDPKPGFLRTAPSELRGTRAVEREA